MRQTLVLKTLALLFPVPSEKRTMFLPCGAGASADGACTSAGAMSRPVVLRGAVRFLAGTIGPPVPRFGEQQSTPFRRLRQLVGI
jgi:hypothetical protein